MSKNFRTVLRFILEAQKEYNSNSLVTSSIHDEICYINDESEVIWLNHCGYADDLIKCNDLVLDHITGELIDNNFQNNQTTA